jgi:hypothetical protein
LIMRRQQDLPTAAFFTGVQAAELLDRADRSILTLSYRWYTKANPDPAGSTLAAVRRYLHGEAGAKACGLFWE